MHRLILLITMILASSLQFAQAKKTEGNYLVVKLSQNNITSDIETTSTRGSYYLGSVTTVTESEEPLSSSNNSIGVALNRSLRLNKFDIFDIALISDDLEDVYINYNLFYDHINYGNYANNKYNLSIKNRYGVAIGLGYDLSSNHAIYVNYGISSLNYEIDSRTSSQVSSQNNGTENNRKISPILFLGYNYKIIENILLGLEYSRQKLDLETVTPKTSGQSGERVYRYSFNTEIETFSLNLSYHF